MSDTHKKLHPKCIDYNDGHLGEAMDRVNSLGEIVNAIIHGHPAIIEHDLTEDVWDIYSAITKLYNKLGDIEDAE